jgi:hypothetical protein
VLFFYFATYATVSSRNDVTHLDRDDIAGDQLCSEDSAAPTAPRYELVEGRGSSTIQRQVRTAGAFAR